MADLLQHCNKVLNQTKFDEMQKYVNKLETSLDQRITSLINSKETIMTACRNKLYAMNQQLNDLDDHMLLARIYDHLGDDDVCLIPREYFNQHNLAHNELCIVDGREYNQFFTVKYNKNDTLAWYMNDEQYSTEYLRTNISIDNINRLHICMNNKINELTDANFTTHETYKYFTHENSLNVDINRFRFKAKQLKSSFNWEYDESYYAACRGDTRFCSESTCYCGQDDYYDDRNIKLYYLFYNPYSREHYEVRGRFYPLIIYKKSKKDIIFNNKPVKYDSWEKYEYGFDKSDVNVLYTPSDI